MGNYDGYYHLFSGEIKNRSLLKLNSRSILILIWKMQCFIWRRLIKRKT